MSEIVFTNPLLLVWDLTETAEVEARRSPAEIVMLLILMFV